MLRTFLKRLFGGAPTMIAAGETAPDFSLLDHQGNTVALGGLAGKRVVLWFYPKADTPG